MRQTHADPAAASYSVYLLAIDSYFSYIGGMAQPKSKQTTPQLSVRSRFARSRASSLAKLTGMTITEVIEDALRAYQPAARLARSGGLIEKGGVLVKPKGNARVTQAKVESELDDIRSGAR